MLGTDSGTWSILLSQPNNHKPRAVLCPVCQEIQEEEGGESQDACMVWGASLHWHAFKSIRFDKCWSHSLVGPHLLAKMLVLQPMSLKWTEDKSMACHIYFFQAIIWESIPWEYSLQEHTVVFLIKQMVGVYQKARASHQGLCQGIPVHRNWKNPSVGSAARTGELARRPAGLAGSPVYGAGNSSKRLGPH